MDRLIFPTFLLFVLLIKCNDTSTGLDPAGPPMVTAGDYSIVETGDTIHVTGIAVDNGDVIKHEWYFKNADGFIETPTGYAFTMAPPAPDSAFFCIYRATDNDGLSATDTTLVWIVESVWSLQHRIISPDGGETFRIGNTLEIRLWPVYGAIGINLFVGDKDLALPGITGTIDPSLTPALSITIPESLNYMAWTDTGFVPEPVSLVSDSCKIRVFNYNQPGDYVESAEYFSISL